MKNGLLFPSFLQWAQLRGSTYLFIMLLATPYIKPNIQQRILEKLKAVVATMYDFHDSTDVFVNSSFLPFLTQKHQKALLEATGIVVKINSIQYMSKSIYAAIIQISCLKRGSYITSFFKKINVGRILEKCIQCNIIVAITPSLSLSTGLSSKLQIIPSLSRDKEALKVKQQVLLDTKCIVQSRIFLHYARVNIEN